MYTSCHGAVIVTSFCALVMSDTMQSYIFVWDNIVQFVITLVASWQEVYMANGPLAGVLLEVRRINQDLSYKPYRGATD